MAENACTESRTVATAILAGGQAIALRELGVARCAAAQLAAFGKQLRPGGAMDCAIHAAAAEQGRIGRVDDGVNVQRRDVGLNSVQCGWHASMVFQSGWMAETKGSVHSTR